MDDTPRQGLSALLEPYKTAAIIEATGVSRQAVSAWRTGRTLPDVAVLPRLARLLKVDLAELTRLVADARMDGGPRSVAV